MANAGTQEVLEGLGVWSTLWAAGAVLPAWLCGATEGVVLDGGAAPWDSYFFPRLQVQHYVEKPSTFVSEIINCGIYLFTPAIFQHIGEVFQRNQQELAL